ncbi:hypothetical protein HAZT_HAZT007428 [Hyalella azteca]|uniref:Tectonin beta-propeller repeat-containing protein 2 n=1 Tax=Hyalella azteca TaxID=294128 RepID=A0A6A0GU30_HYAAZ|nr:hypothetical protein HAZT_HAZT007428 [Hyalella azteca]
MVAAGAADGCISIFLLPRHLTQPSCTPKAGHGNDLKRFSVGSLHSAPITSLAWSSSGLKLVTGDAAGVVGLLEMNHDSCQCLARHLFSESLPIVQLSLYKQKVAVSSEQRCIVYDLQDDRLNVVGTKPRKQPGRFGVAWSRCLPACSGVVPSAEPCNLTSSVVANDVPSVASTDDSRFVPTEISSAAFTDVPNAATADVFSNFHTDIPDVSGTVNTPVVLSSGPVVVNDDAEVSSTEVTAVVDKDDITDSKLENTEGEKNSDGGTDDNEYEDSNTTKHMITDTNITTSSTAVFTSKLSCNSVNTNHEVPAIMSTGINSRPQPTTPESEDAVLYTSRPGQRVWMAVAEGQVRTTLLIKDLPLDTRIQLPGISPSVAPPVLSSVKFENIQVMNTGQLVMHSPDSLVIFNPRTLLVEAFFYRENFIRCVSCTARSVFVLSQAGSIFCISDQPVNVGSSAILHPMHGGAEASRKLFMPPLVLKKLGEKVLTHSSNVIEGVVKLSGSIASRVTDAAAGGYIVNGVASEPCTTEGSFSRYSLSNAQLNTAAKQSLAPDGLSRSMYAETPASEQLLTQSLQERLEPPSEPRYNAPLVDANADTYQGTEARDGTPLVIRGKQHNNLQGYEDSRTSNLGPASSLESTTSELSYYVPSLDGAGPPMQVLRSMSHHDKTILHAEDELTEEVEPMVQLSMKPNGLSAFPSTDGHSGTQEDWSEISLPTPAVAVGGSDDYFVFLDDNNHLHFGDLSERSHITWSSLRLPLSVTAFAVSSSCRSLYLVSGGCLLLCRAQHKESEQILVDSGVHDVVSSLEVGQILDQIISRLGIPVTVEERRGSSVPGEEKRGSPTADEERLGSSAACDDRLESPAPGEERLGSTAPGEERLGSSSPGEERRGSSAPGEERLGSPAPSEERLRSSTPGEERLGCPAPSEERIRSPDEETEVATKSSSNRHTLLCRTDVTSSAAKSTRQDRMFSSQSRDENYLPSRINLPSFFMLLARPLASGVLAVAGDDELVFYVTDDGQVWCLLLTDSQPLRAVEAGRAVLLGSESPLRFVSLAYRDGLLWAMDAKGALHFRAGQSRECPMGLSWGVVQTDQEQDPPPVGDEEEVLERLHSHLVVDPHGLPARSLKPDTQRQHNAHDWLVHNNNNNRADKHTDECNVNDDVSRNPQSLIISHDRAGNRDFQTLSCTPEISSVFSSVVEGIREEVSVHSATQAESVATAAETVAVTTGTVAMTISSGGVAWRVTKCGSVAFRPGVCAAIPQGANTSWWAVGVGERWVDARKPLFTSGGGFVWLCVSKERRVLVLPVATMGSVWTAAGRQRWSMVSAEALYGGHGSLACLNPKGELHLVNPTNFHSEVLTLPDLSPVVCVSQRPEVLWLLTATGDLWIRGGMTSSCNMGTHWHLLDLTQISDVTLRHVSLGLELTWAVDMRGGVYMRQGGLSPPHPYACPQAWLQVDHMRLPGGALFTKVFVGPGRQLVWALDSRHCVYVRVAIFSDLPIGVTWEAVDGVRAINLSISERGRVYAVTEEGHVYERLGVAPPANYVGTAWRKLPGCLASVSGDWASVSGDWASVSVSVDDELWGLSQSGVLCRRQTLHSLHWRRADSCSEPQTAQDSDAGLLLDSETESRRQSIDESWEVIE